MLCAAPRASARARPPGGRCGTARRARCASARPPPRAVGVGALGRHVRAARVAIDLGSRRRAGVETVSPHGAPYIWTRKQGGIARARHRRARRHAARARGPRDRRRSAGYHARDTAWRWSAGVGADGRRRARRLEPRRRAARRAGGVRAHGLGRRRGARGRPGPFDGPGRLAFARGRRAALHRRGRARAPREPLPGLARDYEQPFGTFSGDLPVAGELRRGRRRDGAP